MQANCQASTSLRQVLQSLAMGCSSSVHCSTAWRSICSCRDTSKVISLRNEQDLYTVAHIHLKYKKEIAMLQSGHADKPHGCQALHIRTSCRQLLPLVQTMPPLTTFKSLLHFKCILYMQLQGCSMSSNGNSYTNNTERSRITSSLQACFLYALQTSSRKCTPETSSQHVMARCSMQNHSSQLSALHHVWQWMHMS